MGGIFLAAGKWLWNNKLAALCLVCLSIVSIKLAITATALSIKTKKVAEQEAKITELTLIQKEDKADISALKAYNDRVAQRAQVKERVTVYVDNLPTTTVEKLKSEEANKFNHCMFVYLTTRKLLPECEDKSK